MLFKVLFYYYYYSVYRWSNKGGGGTPLLSSVVWITLTLFLNVITVFSVATICTGIDTDSILSIPESKYGGVAWLSAWGVLVYCLLRVFHVHDKAFGDEMIKKYQEVGCKWWWVIGYIVISFALMAISAWMAGKRLGLH